MKKIEAVAAVLIVLWTVLLLSSSILSFIMMVDLYGPDERGSSIIRMGVLQAQSIVYVLLNFGVAIWLFVQAKRDRARAWVWGLFGLMFGLGAAILYFVMQLIEEMKMKRTAE